MTLAFHAYPRTPILASCMTPSRQLSRPHCCIISHPNQTVNKCANPRASSSRPQRTSVYIRHAILFYFISLHAKRNLVYPQGLCLLYLDSGPGTYFYLSSVLIGKMFGYEHRLLVLVLRLRDEWCPSCILPLPSGVHNDAEQSK